MLYTVHVYNTSLVIARPDQLRIFNSNSLLWCGLFARETGSCGLPSIPGV